MIDALIVHKSLRKYITDNLETAEGLNIVYDEIYEKDKLKMNSFIIFRFLDTNSPQGFDSKDMLQIASLSRNDQQKDVMNTNLGKVQKYFVPGSHGTKIPLYNTSQVQIGSMWVSERPRMTRVVKEEGYDDLYSRSLLVPLRYVAV